MKVVDIHVEETDKSYQLLIGQNKMENHSLLKSCSPNDLWFHLEKQSSQHMILKCNGDHIPKRYLNYIGSLFHKNNNHYTVIYTYLKHVKMTNEPGVVIPTSCKLNRISF